MPHKHHQINFIEFPAKNISTLQKTKKFYETVFGWSYTSYGDDYVDTSSSGISSGINGSKSNQSQMPLAVIYSNNLEASLEKVIAAGGEITQQIFSFAGGRRFHFLDMAGHELAVWSDV